MTGNKATDLLTREQFRNQVFARDGHRCVICGEPAVDAHHILERRLWPDGGYYLDNGASVCEVHHLAAERTTLSVEEVREAAGVSRAKIPDHLYDGEIYTKWGDVVLDDETRTPGELFYDESVQKVLREGQVLDLYRRWVKHPRTMHLPWSASMTEDDRIQHDLDTLLSGEVVVTEKLDGEQTTMYRDHIHARSVDGAGHPSRAWVKNLWSRIAHDIPWGWRVCGENMYAVHSIRYEGLSSFFYVHSIWNEENICLSWDETVEWAELLGLEVVPVIDCGLLDEYDIRDCWTPAEADAKEGYVVRSAQAFPFSEFRLRVAKFVRPDHVRTVKHWMHGKPIEVNGLAKETT